MTEQEKVVKGLTYCIDYAQRIKDAVKNVPCEGCPYRCLKDLTVGSGDCIDTLLHDALALLKEQEQKDFQDGFIGLSEQAFFNPQPVKPNVIMHGKMVMYYQCSACLRTIDPGDRFCRHCGRAVKWDD